MRFLDAAKLEDSLMYCGRELQCIGALKKMNYVLGTFGEGKLKIIGMTQCVG